MNLLLFYISVEKWYKFLDNISSFAFEIKSICIYLFYFIPICVFRRVAAASIPKWNAIVHHSSGYGGDSMWSTCRFHPYLPVWHTRPTLWVLCSFSSSLPAPQQQPTDSRKRYVNHPHLPRDNNTQQIYNLYFILNRFSGWESKWKFIVYYFGEKLQLRKNYFKKFFLP